jgi:hypothetical protein
MKPLTDKVYESQTKRIEFRRRPENQNRQILIIHFEGVIGEIMQRNLGDNNYQVMLRHGTVEGF